MNKNGDSCFYQIRSITCTAGHANNYTHALAMGQRGSADASVMRVMQLMQARVLNAGLQDIKDPKDAAGPTRPEGRTHKTLRKDPQDIKEGPTRLLQCLKEFVLELPRDVIAV